MVHSSTQAAVPWSVDVEPTYAGGVALDPPTLPRRLTDPAPVVAVLTLLWFGAAAALGVAHLIAGRPLDVWFATCACGGVLGLLGLAVIPWQCSAARRRR